MKMPNITPGTWLLTADSHSHIVVDVEGNEIHIGRNEANATAIAALPDVLEAAINALHGWRYLGVRFGLGGKQYEETLLKLETALLKAGCKDA